MKELQKELKAMSNLRRLMILKNLQSYEVLSVGDIAKSIQLSVRSTSRHLAVLRAAGIVSFEQKSLLIFYSLSDNLPDSARYILTLL